MPTESDLRQLFRGPDGDGGLDAGSIIRRAHRRRAPRVVAAAAGALVVVAAVVVPVAGIGLSHGGASTSSAPAEHSAAQGPAGRSQDPKAPSATRRGEGVTGAACVAPPAASPDADVRATLEFADATHGSTVAGILVLTTAGAGEELRITGPVAVTLRRGETVVWSATVDLGAPRLTVSDGAPARLPFIAAPVDCGSGSPPAAGDYTVAASIPVSIAGAAARAIPAAGTLRIR